MSLLNSATPSILLTDIRCGGLSSSMLFCWNCFKALDGEEASLDGEEALYSSSQSNADGNGESSSLSATTFMV